jgi:serine/threonine protein kinase/Tfp pilus assembly protein PilF
VWNIPGYRFEREIARGSLSVVLAARELSLDHEVAVKVLLPDRRDPSSVARLARESRITGSLIHPGIPPVHASGTLADGSPYLVMKLITGQTLAELLKERPDPLHDLPRFIRQFELICQTVGFAHSRGIVHRDLKPSHVMIGKFGEVQVIDWGAARSVSKNSATEETDGEAIAGAVVGTPAYMAPELARGETADERDDVFALGGILCVILTASPPFTSNEEQDCLTQAASGSLTSTFQRLDLCGADPELIRLAKWCLNPNAATRPETGGVVAEAVGAYRSNVEDRLRIAERERATAETNADEQRRKRRRQLTAAIAVILLLAVGGPLAWWMDRQALVRQANESEDASRRAQTAEAVTELLDRCDDALRATDSRRAEVSIDAAEQRAKEGTLGHIVERMHRSRADVNLLKDLDRIDMLRMSISDGQVRVPAAVPEWTKAFAQFGITIRRTPVAEAAHRVNQSLVRDAALPALDHWLDGSHLAELLAILRSADSDPYRNSVREAIATRNTKKLRELTDQSQALTQPARFAIILGTHDAIPVGRARAILAAAVRTQPGDFGLLMALAYLSPQGSDEQESWYRAALALRPENAVVWNNLGYTLWKKKNLNRAVECLQKALKLDPNYVGAWNNLGSVRQDKQDLDGALAAYRKAIELQANFAPAWNNLGNTLSKKGNTQEAIRSYSKAIEIDAKYALPHFNLGVLYQDVLRDLDKAIICYRDAIQIDRRYAAAYFNWGLALTQKDELDEAVEKFQTAAAIDRHYEPVLAEALKQKEQDDRTAPPPRESK